MRRFRSVIAGAVLGVFVIAVAMVVYTSGEKGLPANLSGETIGYNTDIRPILSDKCFACHGPDEAKREAGLRLDQEEEAYKALKDNPAAHAIVPGKPELSEVYLRITSTDEDLRMPPPASNLQLSDVEVAMIRKWIRQGAAYEKHWAFVRPVKAPLRSVRAKEWVFNEIDYFTLHKMEAAGLAPNPAADKERLLKRLSLDLTGLPPSLQEMDEFLSDTRPDAYERLVDRLLNKPAYGEKMAIHWLDIARYADSYGYQMDNYRSQWPWRDWVIHAFNKNLPYNDFVTWQLAGDLLPDATREQLLATGFNRNHKITEEGAVDEEEYRVTYVADRTDTFGKAFLAVTVECARCHDHKYDPVSQKEYYQLFAFFNHVDEMREVYTAIDPSVGTPAAWAKKPMMEIGPADRKETLAFVNTPDSSRLIVSVMGDLDTLRQTPILLRGEFNAYGELVEQGTPETILPFDKRYPSNRLGLAQWLTSAENPLTARVFVNRIWQEIFGKGLVKTAGDFGMQGALPSHPELLDWLAVDFMENGWDIKRLVKQLVTSSTYRQSSVFTAAKSERDPDNRWLSRFPRSRLPAELIRDVVLSSSGLLHATIGGPSVKPYQPPGLWESATAGGDLLLATYRQDHGPALYRRGLYSFIKRTVPPPAMAIFDASNRDQCEVMRTATSTPLQALVMLNDPTVLEAARVLAQNLFQEKSGLEDKLRKGFRMITCRHPVSREIEVLKELYAENQQMLDRERATELLSAGEYETITTTDPVGLASLMQVMTTLYNLEETITKP